MCDQEGRQVPRELIPNGKHLCTCRKCKEKYWLDADGVEHDGQLFAKASTVAKHRLADDVAAEAVTANAILLATVSSSQPQELLPVRPEELGEDERLLVEEVSSTVIV